MTVCTISLFNWFYGKDDHGTPQIGRAFVTASDRMLTDSGLGIEYEASRQKMAIFNPRRIVLVAGDLAFNSLLLQALYEAENSTASESTTQLAFRLSDTLIKLNSDRAFRRYLAPLGLTRDVITEREGGLASFGLPIDLIESLTQQVQAESAESEFIVAGCDNRDAYLFHIDRRGIITSHIDIGFLSIGAEGIHSSAYFMQRPYNHNISLHRAAADTFFAKKRAEICPGVGSITDMQVVTADAIFPLDEEQILTLDRSYKTYTRLVDRYVGKAAISLEKQIATKSNS